MSDKYPSYRIITEPARAEITVKKSRFIATMVPVGTEEEANVFYQGIKKQYWDARHNCTAYVIGTRKELTRCSDDGEPSGTAGKPILEVLLGADVTNAAVVVTRYFGGILLGTGGLVRAYTQAAQESILVAKTAMMCYGHKVKLQMDYGDMGKIQYVLGKNDILVQHSDYTDKVIMQVFFPAPKAEALKKELMEATGARIQIEIVKSGYAETK